MIDLRAFSKISGKYAFGTDKAASVAALRDLADRLESDKITVIGVCSFGQCAPDDFAKETLMIEFALTTDAEGS